MMVAYKNFLFQQKFTTLIIAANRSSLVSGRVTVASFSSSSSCGSPSLHRLHNRRQHSTNTTTATTTDPNQWDLSASLCLIRPPMIGLENNWLERRLKNYLIRYEVANSLYSDHEMRHFEDVRRAERLTTGVNVEEKDLEEAAKQTAQDFEETSQLEAKQFTVASRVTKADLTQNERSIDRFLDKHLHLVLNSSIDNEQHWMLPQAQFDPQNDQSLRSAAERVLQMYFPNTVDKDSPMSTSVYAKFLGNAPAAYYCYRYPKTVSFETGKLGARIFIFKAFLDVNYASKHLALANAGPFGDRLLTPTMDATTSVSDYAWLTYTELATRVHPRYWRKLSNSLYPDELINLEQLVQQKRRKIARLSDRLQKLDEEKKQQQQQTKASTSV